MTDLTNQERILAAASIFIHGAAIQVREVGIFSAQHIRLLAEALAAVSEVRHAIHAIQPELRPKWLELEQANPEADTRLAANLRKADDLVLAQNRLDAIMLLTRYAYHEPSHYHHWKALDERDRMEKANV